MGAHALLSPSSASRWSVCTPSAVLESSFPDSSGTAAKEGTLAHSLGELELRKALGLISKSTYASEIKLIHADPLFTTSMTSYVSEYTTYVLERIAEARSRTPDAVVFLEERLDLTEWIPEGFGTGDAGVISDEILDIIDLKYGKGVPVFAPNNKQMMIYAAGALKKFRLLYDIRTVRMTIHQPRLDTVSTWEISVEDLDDWTEQYLKPKAAQAFKGEGDFIAGDHCRFCRAKVTCRANASFQLSTVKNDFKNAEQLTPEEISEVLTKAKAFLTWVGDVQAYAFDQAFRHGVQWPGFKLVEGCSTRSLSDPEKAAEALETEGYKEEDIYTPKKLLGITALESNMGKTTFAKLLGPFIIKPPGSPTLAPESDKRQPIASSAADDFKNVELN